MGLSPPDRNPAAKLPLLGLPWQYLEEFVREVVRRADGLEECRIYGRQGQRQYGIDLVGRAGGQPPTVYQVRQESSLKPGRLTAALDAYIDAGRRFKAQRFVYVTTASARDTAVQDELATLRRSSSSLIDVDIYDVESLTEAVRDGHLRSLVVRYFGAGWARAVLGEFRLEDTPAHGMPIETYLGALHDVMNSAPAYLPRELDVLALRQPVRIIKAGHREADQSQLLELARARADIASERSSYRVEQSLLADQHIDWDDLLTSRSRIVVLGDPGAGKSWLLRSAALQYGALSVGDDGAGANIGGLPIYVPLTRVEARSQDPIWDVAEAALATVGLSEDAGCVSMKEALHAAIVDGPALLLFDGLDEVPAERLDDVRRLLGRLASLGRTRIVVTSRFAGYAGAPMPLGSDGLEVEVVGFDMAEVRSFLGTWFSGRTIGREFVDQMLLRSGPRSMLQSPLLTSFVCLVAQREGKVPTRATSLLESIMHLILSGGWRESRSAQHIERTSAKLRVLARIAFDAAEAGFPLWLPGEFVSDVVRSTPDYEWLERTAPQGSGLIHELSQIDGILIPPGTEQHPASKGPFAFQHRLLMDYCVARHLADLAGADVADTVERHRTLEPQWYEPLALLPGRLVDSGRAGRAQAVISQIIEPHAPDPGHWRLLLGSAAVANCPDELFSEQRGAVIAGLEPLMTSRSSLDRSRATSALARIGGRAFEILEATAESDNPRALSSTLIRAISQFGAPGYDLLLRMLKDEQTRYGVVHTIVDALVDAGVAEAVPILALRLERASFHDNESRTFALGLARLGPAGEAALSACLRSGNTCTVEHALHGLGKAGGTSVDAVRPFLQSSTPRLRAAAVEVLAMYRGAECLPLLAEMVWDDALYVRATLAHSIRTLGPATAELFARLASDNATDVRYAVAEFNPIGDIGPNVILQLIRDADPRIRAAAVRSVGSWLKTGRSDDALKEVLRSHLDDADWGVRVAAAQALEDVASEVALLPDSWWSARSTPTDDARTADLNYRLRLNMAASKQLNRTLRTATLEFWSALERLPAEQVSYLLRRVGDTFSTTDLAAISQDGDDEQRMIVAKVLRLLPPDAGTVMASLFLSGDANPAIRRAASDGARAPEDLADAFIRWVRHPENVHPPRSWEEAANALLRLDPSVAEDVVSSLVVHEQLGENVFSVMYELMFSVRLLSRRRCDEAMVEMTNAMLIGESPNDRASSVSAERSWRALQKSGWIPRVARAGLVEVLLGWPGRESEALGAAREATSKCHGWRELVNEADAASLCGDLRGAARALREATHAQETELRDSARRRAARVALWRGTRTAAEQLLGSVKASEPHFSGSPAAAVLQLINGNVEQLANTMGVSQLPRHLRILHQRLSEGVAAIDLAPRVEKAISATLWHVPRVHAGLDVRAVAAAWASAGLVSAEDAITLDRAAQRGRSAADTAWLSTR